MGELPSQELAAAMVGVDRRDMRRARRSVRRGKAADDVPAARYAVAFARERRRRLGRYPSFRFSILGCGAIGAGALALAVDGIERSRVGQAIGCGGFAAFMILCGIQLWLERRHLAVVEQVNMEYLRRAGAPYVPGGPPTSVRVAPLTVVCSLVALVALTTVVSGVAASVLNGGPLSVGRVFSEATSGVVGVVVTALLGIAAARQRDRDALGRAAREYQYLRDLD